MGARRRLRDTRVTAAYAAALATAYAAFGLWAQQQGRPPQASFINCRRPSLVWLTSCGTSLGTSARLRPSLEALVVDPGAFGAPLVEVGAEPLPHARPGKSPGHLGAHVRVRTIRQ